MKSILLQVKSLTLLMLCSLSISAATLPDYYPKEFNHMQGTVDDIDIKTGRILINDMQWKLSMNIKVHSLNTEFSSVQVLRKNMNVTFKIETINGKSVIAEIWILPNDYYKQFSE